MTPRSTVVILPFTICSSCRLPAVLADFRVDPKQADRVELELAKCSTPNPTGA